MSDDMYGGRDDRALLGLPPLPEGASTWGLAHIIFRNGAMAWVTQEEAVAIFAREDVNVGWARAQRSPRLALVIATLVAHRAVIIAFVLGVLAGAALSSYLDSRAPLRSDATVTVGSGGSAASTIDYPERALPLSPKSNESSDIIAVVRNAAVEFGQDPERMIAVARCESSLRSDAVGDGGQAVGLWQFHPDTYVANARRLFRRDASPDERLDPVSSSLVAAWMWSIGQAGQWSCAR